MKKIAVMMMMLMMSICMFAKGETKVVVFTPTPAMHCMKCEKKIKDNVRFVKGVKKIETSVEKQTITITYDAAKTTPEKIEAGLNKIGYKVKKK